MVDFLGDFTRRTLASLGRFREADPPAPLPFGTPGAIADTDFNAWERCKANMAIEELGRWEKMNLAEAAARSRVCETCGGRAETCKCDSREVRDAH